ncbi:major facilitator superfamily domain-containing protein [Roridomyces roridus]|uniref:Major facilitator superfamily domain-containing protein n=1 Tax=Roridomyces roridus TaxID=1738132 RepID=A0AAD7FL59_9AGAR|nr:major facilitator superfamily domain-containing protein [Roridomyces roridus]
MTTQSRTSVSPTLTMETARDAEKAEGQPGGKELPMTPVIAPPPDGGLAAWLTILGTSLVAFSTFGTVNGYGAFNDYYSDTYLTNYSATLISMIGAIQIFILYIFAGLSGALFDAYGPRYMIPASGIVTSFSFFMLSLTKPQHIYQQFLTHAVLFSLGASFGFFPALAVCAHWFKRRLAFAIGFPVGFASAGGIIFPVMLVKLIPRIGFGWTVRAIAFIVLGCYAIASITITTPRPRKPLPRLSQLFAFRAFRDPTYTLLCVAGWFSVFSTFNPFFFVGLYGAAANGGEVSAITPYYLPIACATAIFGRIGPAFIADRVGRFNVISISTALSGIFILALWYTSTDQPNLIAFAAVYGFASGPFFSLLSPCVIQISPISEVGARIGMAFVFMSTGAFAGTPIGGVFITTPTVKNFQHLILFSGIMGLVGSAFFFAARLTKERKLFVAI